MAGVLKSNQDHSKLRDDVLCVKSGYNLRTLSTTSKCPECGEAVQLTLSSFKARPRPHAMWAFAFAAIPIVSAYSLTLNVAKVFWFFDESVFYFFVYVTIPCCVLIAMILSVISISRWDAALPGERVIIILASVITSIEFVGCLVYGYLFATFQGC